MKNITLIFVIQFLLGNLLFAQNTKTINKNDLNEFISYVDNIKKNDQDLRHALWSVSVADPQTGKLLYQYNSNMSVLPASNMKLITTGIGLLTLGSKYKFKTKLEYSGEILDSILNGDIYIVGGGDPTLGSNIYKTTNPNFIFSQWTTAIQNLGVKQINGRIISDTRFFDDETRHGSWEFNDLGFDYGAGACGVQFMDNRCSVYLEKSIYTDKKPKLMQVKPYIPNISWENYLVEIDNKDDADWEIYSSPYSNRALLTGSIWFKNQTKKIAASIPNTAYTCAWYFNKYLNENGIATANNIEVIERKTPITDSIMRINFYTYQSPEISEIIKETNKESNNSYAETIVKTISAELSNNGTIVNGCSLIADKLESLGLKTDGFKQKDGSGLSRHNYVTTKFLCAFLSLMYQSDSYKAFAESLPVAGVDGTMKNMLRKTKGEGKVKAKSGTMSGVKAYSGYVSTQSGTDLCFSFVMNNYTCKSAVVTKKLEKLMLLLAKIEN